MTKKNSNSFIKIAIIIAFVLCCIIAIGYYYMYQDSEVVSAVQASQTALNSGDLTKAIQDLDNLGGKTFADRQLLETQETAIKNYENISTQYNTAANYINNSEYGQALPILNSLHTNNKYLSTKIQNAITISNESFPQLLYKEGVDALKSDNKDAASKYYSQLENFYPNSSFTKQLGDYLAGNSNNTIDSYNIVISRPNLDGISASQSASSSSGSTLAAISTPKVTQVASTPKVITLSTSTTDTKPSNTNSNVANSNTTAPATNNASNTNSSNNNNSSNNATANNTKPSNPAPTANSSTSSSNKNTTTNNNTPPPSNKVVSHTSVAQNPTPKSTDKESAPTKTDTKDGANK
ncbi:hypothetical protein [uncultured Clostridium sp.]|uniref:hypothetical protein n=1 Tax=uncultured Clostridium sp. TaxID=59620 RepID=UPI002632D117|nr:hypothetical protein [uncultured Clostridium sp.]